MKISTDTAKIEELLTRGVENIYPNREALWAALESGKQLTLYLGIDPTGPTLHIGHGFTLLKLRDFQALGHKVILLIGDFTAMIGDPTDKAATRKQLTRDEVLKNCKEYTKQASAVLDIKKTEVKYNSKWFMKMYFHKVLDVASEITIQRLLERDMFDKRIKEGKPVYAHEVMYPLMQGYDSVAMGVDLEVGGNDQTFNMLVGRDMMKRRGKEKFVVATKLLTDPTGAKMGKTEGNMVALSDSPEEMYGKVMSWPDTLLPLAFEIGTRVPMDEVKKIVAGNPRDAKMSLAREIVTLYHGAAAAKKAEEQFVKTFQKHETPSEISEIRIKDQALNIVDLLVKAKLAASKSEARRVIEQSGVQVDGKVVKDPNAEIKLSKDGVLVQKGKRHFVRVYGS